VIDEICLPVWRTKRVSMSAQSWLDIGKTRWVRSSHLAFSKFSNVDVLIAAWSY
jgi:hypothetical protein